jgi:hypothetical protein
MDGHAAQSLRNPADARGILQQSVFLPATPLT